jgi:hypothetical protein
MNLIRNPARTVSAFLLFASVLSAQIAYFPDNVPSTGAANTIPYRESTWGTSGYTSYHVYPASVLTAAGIPAGAFLTDIALSPTNATGASGTINIAITKVTIGHLALNPPQAGQWLNNVATPTTLWDTATDGAYTFPWTADTWVSLPIACHGAGFAWDGVSDIIFFQTQAGSSTPGGGWTGGFSVHTSPTSTYIRHGLNAYNPTVGTAPSTTGTLGMRMRMTFGTSGCFGLLATTTGGGTGDLALALINLPAAASEGYLLATSTTVGIVGSGPFFGIWPSAVTFDCINSPASPGNPLHFLTGYPGLWPDVPILIPPGALSGLAGQVWDLVVVALGPGMSYVNKTNAARLNW